ncbi:MAG: hypothetical protein M1832_005282 [Thelocarpon impressellum]|nr:MAG: hypothetical protein M1832_005282 [Thelocarpon impressellum]
MALSRPKTLALLPLAADTVLLPGIIVRIPLAKRPDILALLSEVYNRAGKDKARSSKADAGLTTIGCVPLKSPLLDQDGHELLLDIDPEAEPRQENERPIPDPARSAKQDLFNFGTVAKIYGVEGKGTGNGEVTLLVEGVDRFRVDRITKERPYFEAQVTYHNEQAIGPSEANAQDLFAQLKQLSRDLLTLLRLSSLLPSLLPRGSAPTLSPFLARRLETFVAKKDARHAGVLADFMSNVVETTLEEKLQVLAAWHTEARLEKVIEILRRQVDGIKGNVKITSLTSTSFPTALNIDQINRKQRDPLSRRHPLGLGIPSQASNEQGEDDEEEVNEIDELKQKLDDAKLTPEAQRVAQRELKRLRGMNPAQAEYQVCRNYLENLSEIPWSKMTEDRLGPETLARARRQLDDDHYGLEKIKKRLLEYLAVLRLKQNVNADLDAQAAKAVEDAARISDHDSDAAALEDVDLGDAKVQVLKSTRMVDKSPILLLVGPPGTGKTSLAKSVATALGRKFHRISLGGVRDEAEIRGHRRTYVAAMPGLIVNGLKKVGVANPVILLDEIDKVSTSNFHGDPSAALLEVLDPEQNYTFTDHFVNIPIDLSKVLFIATANSLETIPAPLLDRMETISLSGYTALEKRHIASQHLVPKQITTNGLKQENVQFTAETLDKIINSYTRESGVRNLEREIGSVCRAKAVQFADAQDASKLDAYKAQVTVDDLDDILGIEKYDEEIAETKSRPGIVTGLVAYSSGGNGSILFIEVADMPGSGRVQLTGKLGDVLKESVEVALTWVKAHSFELGLTNDASVDIMKNRSVHVHCPSGAIPKDGPSAGLAHTIALISLFSGRAVPPTLAMTGEMSLRGRVTAVGGIKEKLIGALRAGVKTVLLPAQNRKDAKDLPQEVKDGLDIIHVG